MFYDTYKKARDAAWWFLIETGARTLPLPVTSICQAHDILLMSDTEKIILGSDDRGISFQSEGRWHILLNSNDSLQIRRYTIAHELGHIYMGHPMQSGKYGRTFGVQSIISSPIEYQAERFAIGVLAPACVLYGLGLHTAESISKVCGISFSAAQRRAKRMEVLYERGMFFSHPLEKQVFEQFSDFIHNKNGR